MQARSTPPILYISYDGMTDSLGQSQVLPYLKKLSLEGYKFVVLSCEKPASYEKIGQRVQLEMEEYGISWVPIPYTKFPPVLSTIYDYWKLKRAVSRLHAIHHFGIVHCRSYIASMLGLWMKRRFKVKFIFDMRGFWADERVEGGLWNLSNPIYRCVYKFFKFKERQFLNEADHIVSLTYAGKTELEGWHFLARQALPITVIPCCVDTDLFNPSLISETMKADARKELGISNDEPVLSYLGSIGTWYLLDEMLQFFRVYLQSFPQGKFLFITHDDPQGILNKARDAGIARDRIIITCAERSKVPVLVSLSAYSIFFIKPVFSKKSSSPTKQGEIMALGIPVICNKNIGDTDYIVAKYGSGLLVDGFNDKSYFEVANNLARAGFPIDKLRQGAIEYFDLKMGASRYAKIYQELLI